MAYSNIILIPSTSTEAPLGSIFNNFFVISSATESLESSDVVWDFSNVVSIHPVLAACLAFYKNATSKNIESINRNKIITSYLEDICFDKVCHVNSDNISDIKDSFRAKPFIPICSFNAINDDIQQHLQHLIIKQCQGKGITTPLSYMLGELICNVYQHADTEEAYMFSQFEKDEDSIFICIADKGIGIFSSYVKAVKYTDKIGDSDAEALKIANEGYSTKNLPHAENRGFGISTSKKMLVNGLGGELYIMSGSALQLSLPYCKDTFLELPNNVEWQGTMIILKLPRVAPDGFVYTDYLE